MNSNLILNQPGFVLSNARVLASFAQRAYDVTPGDLKIASARTDTVCGLSEFDDCLVIAFRGTADWRNWVTDAEFPLRHVADLGAGAVPVRVHEGFLAALDSVLPEIVLHAGRGGDGPSPRNDNPSLMKWGQAVPTPVKPLVLTGHSLGGALAVLCAWLLAGKGWPVHSIYTYGQPRVGDEMFATAYAGLKVGQASSLSLGADRLEACPTLGDRTFRLVNQTDIVPRLPGLLLGYRHAGQLEFINARGMLVENPSVTGRMISDAWCFYQAYRRLDDVLINDHFMGRYLAALGN